MIIINKILNENGVFVPERSLTEYEKSIIIFCNSDANSYIYYTKDEYDIVNNINIEINKFNKIPLYDDNRTVLLKTDLQYNNTEYKIGFRSSKYSINEYDYVIEIFYDKFIYDVNDMLVDYIGFGTLYVRKGRTMPEFDINGNPTGGIIDEYDQWIEILTSQKNIDPRPFVQQAILTEENILI